VAIAATGESVLALILIDPTGRPIDRIKDWQTYDPEHKEGKRFIFPFFS
jgi:hypothetical protein